MFIYMWKKKAREKGKSGKKIKGNKDVDILRKMVSKKFWK